MKILSIFLLLTLPFVSSGQLDFEAITGTSLNMSLKQEFRSIPGGPRLSTPHNFVGGGFDIGLGFRFRLSKHFAVSGAIEYQYKGHESNFLLEPKKPVNTKHAYHLLVLPFDISYTFKCQIAIHLGAELIKILQPTYQHILFAYQEKPVVGGLLGLSYTYKRLRFELFYKHHFMHYMRTTVYFNIGQNVPYVEVSHYNHWCDVQVRVVVRLFSVR